MQLTPSPCPRSARDVSTVRMPREKAGWRSCSSVVRHSLRRHQLLSVQGCRHADVDHVRRSPPRANGLRRMSCAPAVVPVCYPTRSLREHAPPASPSLWDACLIVGRLPSNAFCVMTTTAQPSDLASAFTGPHLMVRSAEPVIAVRSPVHAGSRLVTRPCGLHPPAACIDHAAPEGLRPTEQWGPVLRAP